MVGYSGTPLPKKLGIKPGHLVMVVDPDTDWPDGWPAEQPRPPDDATMRFGLRGGPADVILACCKDARQLKRRIGTLKNKIKVDGALWIAWPKKAAKMATDLDGNVVRTTGLDAGLVDVKVCAVDERWSGLKFVYRLADRKG